MKTLLQNITKLLGTVLLVTIPMLAVSPLLNEDRPNVWVIDNETGMTVSTLNINAKSEWSTKAHQQGGTEAVIILDDNSEHQVTTLDLTSPTRQSIVTNELNGSFPLPDMGILAVSVSGIDATLTPNENTPVISILPYGGTFSETVEVRLRAVSARNLDPKNNPMEFKWYINGVSHGAIVHYDETKGFETSFFLAHNDDYRVRFSVRQNTIASEEKSVDITISGADNNRDTDGDGIPDIWEVEHGLDPLSDSFSLDSDGDGLADFDEALRDSDPSDPNSTPLDTDLDGWFDFDEIQLRGTDANDSFYQSPQLCDPEVFKWVSRPSASRLYEVEHNLTGGIFRTDVDLKEGSTLKIRVVNTNWDSQYDSRDLWDVAILTDTDLNGCTMGIDVSSLPDRFRLSIVESDLIDGMVPQGLRVAAGISSVVHIQEINSTTGIPDKWVVKSWLENYADLIPAEVTPLLTNANGYGWSTASEWETQFIEYLHDHLVVNKSIGVSPQSTVPIAMMESIMAWVDGEDVGPTVRLGDPLSRRPLEGISTMQSDLRENNSSLDLLHSHLVADLQLNLLQVFNTNALALYEEDANLSATASTTYALASMLQNDNNNTDGLDAYDEEAVYLARLQFMIEPDLLADIDQGFLDLNDDADSDILINRDELLQSYDDVLSAGGSDTDGDGLTDANDPCPVDASNNCLMDNDLFKDSDGDGIQDYVDNCVDIGNSDQNDTDGNGFGDECEADYHIFKPATDVTIMVGESVTFESIQTGSVAYSPSFEWTVNDDVNSTLESPGEIVFASEGIYTIDFIVYDGIYSQLQETRTITVLQYNRSTPTAISDTYSVESGGTLNVTAANGVLINDRDADADTINAILVGAPANASSFAFNSDGSFTYQHDGTAGTQDSFTYIAFDGKANSNEATVVIEIDTQSVSPMNLGITPVEYLFGTKEGTATFTVFNQDTVNVTLPEPLLRGAQSEEFSIENDTCNGVTLQPDANCTLDVRYPATSGRSISTQLQVNDYTAFIHNFESIDEEAARRLPPVLFEINIPEEMNSEMTYDLNWSIIGYNQNYLTYVAFFDCSVAPEGECGRNITQTALFDKGLRLSPDRTEVSDWNYLGVRAIKSTYSHQFAPTGFTEATPIVIRFYYKSLADDTAGNYSMSLIIPGNLSDTYYDTSGRKIQKTICPSDGCIP